MRFVERNTTQRTFMIQTAMKMQDFWKIIKSFSLKTIVEKKGYSETWSHLFENFYEDA